MESIEKLAEVTKPDVRQKRFGASDLRTRRSQLDSKSPEADSHNESGDLCAQKGKGVKRGQTRVWTKSVSPGYWRIPDAVL